ncbi:MAG: radical SAM protein [Candidatus Aminicenantes bacterium]|nr:MAG: radical SAM protein [Candidatus Aminicenantes bacterium]
MKDINVSEYLYFQQVDTDNDISVGWNRFFPTIFILNRFALELLEAVKNKKKIDQDDETRTFFKELFKYKFIYDTQQDQSQEDFLKMIDDQLSLVKEKGDNFCRLKNGYEGMDIFTDECNLTCPYCVNQYKRKHAAVKKDFSQRLEIINRCIDQYVSQRLANASESKPVRIFFNGGEILLEWETIKAVVCRLSETYKGIPFEFEMNTNLTLMTEEIAEFLSQHNFKVHISIDGYGRAHNRTRRYHNGKGSFADLLKKLKMYRELSKKNPITVFQGTIEYIDDFEPEKVYEMESHGFLNARLAPNLLNVPEEDALQKAELMGKFLELNTRYRFQVTELFFSKAKDRINQDEYRFSFNCRGLSCLPIMTLNLNISTLRVSQLCAYVPEASMPLEDLGYDIYNKKLWEVSCRFIKQRMEAIKKYCLDCHLVGLCSGGCIYTGLDNENQLNKSACAFQKKLWSIYINKVYSDNPPATRESSREDTRRDAKLGR